MLDTFLFPYLWSPFVSLGYTNTLGNTESLCVEIVNLE